MELENKSLGLRHALQQAPGPSTNGTCISNGNTDINKW
jgi:hypothetical protein